MTASALLLLPVAFCIARAIDAFAAYRRRTDPWGRA